MQTNTPASPAPIITHPAQALQDLRHALGISLSQMADILGLTGEGSADAVRFMESGKKPVSRPIQIILRYMQQAIDIERSSQEADLIAQVLPKWLDCAELDASDTPAEIIMHTRWPRFYGIHIDKLPETSMQALHHAQIPVIALRQDLGLGHLACIFIDRPSQDPQDLLREAARLKEAQALQDLQHLKYKGR